MATWEERFLAILREHYRHDETCLRIASNDEFGKYCGTMMRRYVSPEFREAMDEDRRKRMERRREELVKAIDGLESAANLYRPHEPETAALFQIKAAELIGQKERVDQLLDTKRHGRFRDEGILDIAKQEMEKHVGPVTYETLANLVNAGFEADGQETDEGATVNAESLRRNLANFRSRNPNWNRTTGNSKS
jgi:hypothetical protein